MIELYGAMVEAGEVADVAGAGLYRVNSLTRKGITTPPIPALTDKIAGMIKGMVVGMTVAVEPLAKGDEVYFYMLDDGTGMILWRKS